MYDIINKIIGKLQDLPSLIEQAMSTSSVVNKKDKQTAVTSPSADGSTLAFIDTISQNDNGVITPTKKNVSVANNLTTEAEGSVLDARQGKVLNDAISGKKSTQTAVTDPTADGNALAFIDTISQDTNGVITPTKKNVNVANNLTTTSSGSVLDARQGKVLKDAIDAQVKLDQTTAGVTISHADYTNVDSNKPSDTSYTWRLIAVLPGAATCNVVGIDSYNNRFMALMDGGASATMQVTMSWLGFKN